MRSWLALGLSIVSMPALAACANSTAARARAQEIVGRVNAPLSSLHAGMEYAEVIGTLKHRQALVEREPVLREMKWTWTQPSHVFTVEHEGKCVLAVSPRYGGPVAYTLLFVDGRLSRAIDLREVGQQVFQEHKTSPLDSLARARRTAQVALLAPAIEFTDLPARLTDDERPSVQQYLRGGDFPSVVVVALAPVVMASETQANIDRAEYEKVEEQYDAIDVALGSDASLLRARWGEPRRIAKRDDGTETIAFTSPSVAEWLPVIEVLVDVLGGQVRAVFTTCAACGHRQ